MEEVAPQDITEQLNSDLILVEDEIGSVFLQLEQFREAVFEMLLVTSGKPHDIERLRKNGQGNINKLETFIARLTVTRDILHEANAPIELIEQINRSLFVYQEVLEGYRGSLTKIL